MINFEDRLNQALEKGYDFSPSEVLSQAYETVKAKMGEFIGFMIIYLIVSGSASSLASAIAPGLDNLVSLFFSALWLPGYYYAAQAIRRGQPFSFNLFMDGHKKAGKLIGYQFLLTILIYLPLMPAIASLFFQDNIIAEFQLMQEIAQTGEFYMPQLSGLSIGLLIVGFFGTLYLSFSYTLGQVILTIADFGIWESLEASRKLVQKNFLTFVGLFFLIIGINILGTLLLFVGLLVSVPVSLVVNYVVLEKIFQLYKEDDHEQNISDHFVDQ